MKVNKMIKNRITKLVLILIIQAFLLILTLEFIEMQGAYNSRYNKKENWIKSLKK